jgi:pyruvate carboxylase
MAPTARLLPQLWSSEAWGGATYDVALRFLKEDPWERLAQLHELMPNIPLQMLLRGRNTVGYTPYPLAVTKAFVNEAAATGLDVFRIFDSLNNVEQIRPAIDQARNVRSPRRHSATPSMPRQSPTSTTTCLADQLVAAARTSSPQDRRVCSRHAARCWCAPCASVDLPAPAHPRHGWGQFATCSPRSRRRRRGRRGVGGLGGTTSQVPMSALIAATDGTERATGLSLDAATALEPYFETVRVLYGPFESGLPGPTGRVYHHEIPGGQLSNLRQQAISLGLGDRFEAIEDMYAAANGILGNIVKVTPSSKVVGDLALALVGANADPGDFEANPQRYDIPDSVIGFLNGDLGDPPGGWPEPFRTKALEGRVTRPVESECRRPTPRRSRGIPVAPSTGCSSPGPPTISRTRSRSSATCPCYPAVPARTRGGQGARRAHRARQDAPDEPECRSVRPTSMACGRSSAS